MAETKGLDLEGCPSRLRFLLLKALSDVQNLRKQLGKVSLINKKPFDCLDHTVDQSSGVILLLASVFKRMIRLLSKRILCPLCSCAGIVA